MSASTRNLIAWVLQVVLGLAFMASGFNKLRDMAGTIGMFNNLGLPSVLAYVVAGGELLGGIGLLIPRFTRPSALGLIIIMIGAVIMHLTRIPGGMAGGLPATALLVLLALLLWLRQPVALPVGNRRD